VFSLQKVRKMYQQETQKMAKAEDKYAERRRMEGVFQKGSAGTAILQNIAVHWDEDDVDVADDAINQSIKEFYC
jgi:hypothetical protein